MAAKCEESPGKLRKSPVSNDSTFSKQAKFVFPSPLKMFVS